MTLNASLYSPRWGHEDGYNIIFERDGLTIQLRVNPLTATKATWETPDSEAVWVDNGRGLFNMLANDQIHPPRVLPDLLEHLWRKWRLEEMTPEQVESELTALVNYINIGTHGKPTTAFWNGCF